ncbi:RNA 2',3'-cyclic phosphodiesterase [Saccharibacillus sp. CPCC 101409]|uniref:RNA 2',3'-cyclic phosphodiesterase n=1 Tax=Saccharibacillus sp. CPCC 101409 TaxID=3058041 RepID=UPI0026728B5D|nr:RNA 2',3'-cyclic phosphodiesterase [Saccharibacillus sp. CPCC 101409]MDO3408570.1 RNA 2',3'-cyclic phosphodiesterase [Saccharibacillus sp. CPCC 101409]
MSENEIARPGAGRYEAAGGAERVTKTDRYEFAGGADLKEETDRREPAGGDDEAEKANRRKPAGGDDEAKKANRRKPAGGDDKAEKANRRKPAGGDDEADEGGRQESAGGELRGQGEEAQRIFAAVPVEGPAALLFAAWAREAAGEEAFRRWTDARDYHLTLKFLGDVEPERIPAIAQALREALAPQEPFALSLDGAGTFGLPDAPRVLYAEPAEGMEPLARLAAAAEAALAPLGFAPEKRSFRAHMTLARKYAGRRPFAPDVLAGAPKSPVGMIDRAVLYRTHMHRRPMYERIAEFPLRGGKAAGESAGRT